MARKTLQTYEKPWSDNPWYEGHRQAEIDYSCSEYTPKMAQNLVDLEWWRHGDLVTKPRTCPGCRNDIWYRVTVGAYVCHNDCEYPNRVWPSGKLWDWEQQEKAWMTYQENLVAA